MDEQAGEGAHEAATPAQRPTWTYFLAPGAILLGSLVIAAAAYLGIRANDDDPVAAVPVAASTGDTASSTLPGSGGAAPQDLLTVMRGYAKTVGLDPAKFDACITGAEASAAIQAQYRRGAELGVSGTPTFAINNKFLVGAQPAEVFEEIIAGELRATPPASAAEYSSTVQQLAASGRFSILAKAPDSSDAPIEGDRKAKVIIAEFSDFQCPFCKRWVDQVLGRLKPKFGKDVALAFLHFPITQIHPNAGNAAVVAYCADRQGKFWPMHDLLFARQAEWEKAR
jgi:protein-disulfide isomerase